MRVNVFQQLLFLSPIALGFLATSANKILVNAAGKILNNDSINIFLGTTNNLWNVASNWNLGRVPNSSDRVVIRANCLLNVTTTIARLTVESTRTLSWQTTTTRILTINSDYINNGTIDMSGGSLAHQIVLKGLNLSSSGSFIAGLGTFEYSRNADQNLLNISHYNLRLGPGVGGSSAFEQNKIANFNLTVNTLFIDRNQSLNISGDLTVNSTATVSYVNCIDKSNSGTINFLGNLIYSDSCGINTPLATINIGANVTHSGGSGTLNSANLNIINNSQFSGTNIILGVLNGTTGSSAFDNRGITNYNNATVPMSVGQLQCNNASNTFNYVRAGNQDVKGTTYRSLIFSGSGTKKLLGNITCDSFELAGSASINFNGFTITINNDLIYSKSGAILAQSLLNATNLYIRNNITLVENCSFTNIFNDNGDRTITFAGFTLTSTGTSNYTASGSQKLYGSANWIYNNLTLGGTGTPNNKTMQGNVNVPGTYTVTGNAVRVNNGFTFTP